VLLAAEKNLFQKILYDGVEGYNDDKLLVERNSSVLDACYQRECQEGTSQLSETAPAGAAGTLNYSSSPHLLT